MISFLLWETHHFQRSVLFVGFYYSYKITISKSNATRSSNFKSPNTIIISNLSEKSDPHHSIRHNPPGFFRVLFISRERSRNTSRLRTRIRRLLKKKKKYKRNLTRAKSLPRLERPIVPRICRVCTVRLMKHVWRGENWTIFVFPGKPGDYRAPFSSEKIPNDISYWDAGGFNQIAPHTSWVKYVYIRVPISLLPPVQIAKEIIIIIIT